jgi:hypothetical protein
MRSLTEDVCTKLLTPAAARFSGIFFQKFAAVEIRPQLHADSGVERKSCEDALDAVVCAWGAMCALEGRAAPFGDESSAIWIAGVRWLSEGGSAKCAATACRWLDVWSRAISGAAQGNLLAVPPGAVDHPAAQNRVSAAT